MDYRLILNVLLVALSWRFMDTYAQSGDTFIGAPSVTASEPTVEAEITNATTVAGDTAATATTTTMIPVATLEDAITTTDCGSKKLCVAEPMTCDPALGSQCYFVSAKQQSGQLYDFELSGQSDGYIAAGVSTSFNQTDIYQTYICANHNGTVSFFTGMLMSFMVILESLDASNVKGKVNSNKIQCTFSATLPNTTTRAAGYSMSVSTGSYDPTTEEFGTPMFKIQTPIVSLSDPNATISNLINGTDPNDTNPNDTNSNNTDSTSGAYPVAHQQSVMMPALLLIVTILAFIAQ